MLKEEQDRSVTTQTVVPIYKEDLELVKKFRDSQKFKNLAEAMKVIVEYANAHGVLL